MCRFVTGQQFGNHETTQILAPRVALAAELGGVGLSRQWNYAGSALDVMVVQPLSLDNRLPGRYFFVGHGGAYDPQSSLQVFVRHAVEAQPQTAL